MIKKAKKSVLISVLMPIYNAEKYLAGAINSILSQTVGNFELICINDGSTDNSGKILAQYAKKDKRIIILTNKKNLGMTRSLNKAINIAQGQYIARMDADDISLPTRFEKQVELLEKNKNLVAVGGQEEIINGNGQVIAEKNFPTDSNQCYQTLANFMPIQPPLLMARGEAMRKYRYDTKLCPNDDINIYFKLLKEGSFSNVDEVIFKYRQINTSLTHKNSKKVYFMALKNRIDGIINQGYRPSVLRVALALVETGFVFLIPSQIIVKTFEWLRYIQIKPALVLPSFSWLTAKARE
ncbi:MAG: glycosyltransferase family 2 protein [Candidatus Shapirobacteria bacterium]